MARTYFCPQCQRAEMELDGRFPDRAVFKCPVCCWYVTPRTYWAQWQEIVKDIDPVCSCRRIIWYVLGLLAILLAIWSLTP
jgi:hypothetical protein